VGPALACAAPCGAQNKLRASSSFLAEPFMRGETASAIRREYPFGSQATGKIPCRPLALRPGLATGLPLSRIRDVQAVYSRESRRI
jgi:hypothetical protein